MKKYKKISIFLITIFLVITSLLAINNFKKVFINNNNDKYSQELMQSKKLNNLSSKNILKDIIHLHGEIISYKQIDYSSDEMVFLSLIKDDDSKINL